jgi:hypothetical protein
MLAGSKELECDRGIISMEVCMAAGTDKASAVLSAAFVNQSRPGDQAWRCISHYGSPEGDSTPALSGIHHNSQVTHLT